MLFFRTLILAAICLPVVVLAQTVQTATVTVPSGRHLVVEGWQNTSSNRWVVYVPGSGCNIFPAAQSMWIKALSAPSNSSVMVINKSGAVFPTGCNLSEFNPGSLRSARIADVLFVLQNFIPTNAKIWLAGESEGAYIAPDIALQDKRVSKLFLFSAGTRSWIDEEISFALPEKQAAVRQLLETEVVGHPSYTNFYDGWTYAQLDSYNTKNTLLALTALNIPVFMLNGANDHETWVAATSADVTQLISQGQKSNIEFHLIDRANHALGCDLSDGLCQPGQISGLELSFLQPFMSKN